MFLQRWDEIKERLTEIEIEAIAYLVDKLGFTLLTDVKVEDCRKADGNRMRTFAMSARYSIALVKKEITMPDAKPVENIDQEVVEDSKPDQDDGPTDNDEAVRDSASEDNDNQTNNADATTPDAAASVVNPWDNINGWIRKSKKAFAAMIKAHGDELATASDHAQERAKRKCQNLKVKFPK